MVENEPIGMLHDDVAGTDPQRTAIIDGATGTTITYGDLAESVSRVAGALDATSLSPGDRVPLCYPNRPRFVVLFLAIRRTGAVPVLMNLQLDRWKVAHVLEDCDASVVIADAAALERPAIRGGLDDIDDDVAVLVDGEPPADCRADGDWLALRELTARAEIASDPVTLTGSDPAVQAYTSGSTGDPKGVVLSQRGVRWCTDSFREFLEITQDERGLVVTPLYHKNAMTGVVKPCLAAGASCVVLPEFEREAVLEAIETYDVTYLTGVPAIYKRLVEAPALVEAYDTASLSWASCGSAAVPGALAGQFEDVFDATLLEVYGLTEGGPVVTHSPRDGAQKVGSAGLALPGCRTRVVDPETGEELPDGDPGELLVSNPGLGTYYERPSIEWDAFETIDGTRWLHTGDLARKDEDGYHFILGRLDDMMIVGGENLYPADVEERVLQHDAVTDVAVVSVPHATKGEAPVAFVVTDRPVTATEIIQFALDRGPAFAHPRRVFVLDEIPLSGTGKAETETLQQRALERIDGSL